MTEEQYKSQSDLRMESVLRKLGNHREVWQGADATYILLEAFEGIMNRIEGIEDAITALGNPDITVRLRNQK